MKTQDIQTLISAATAAMTPVMNALADPEIGLTPAEKSHCGWAYYTLMNLKMSIRQQQTITANLQEDD